MKAESLEGAEKGISTAVLKLNGESIDKERKHRKHKDSETKKIKDYKKHKHRHKSEGDDHNRTSNGHYDSKTQNKKRRHERNGDLSGTREHKKSQNNWNWKTKGYGLKTTRLAWWSGTLHSQNSSGKW